MQVGQYLFARRADVDKQNAAVQGFMDYYAEVSANWANLSAGVQMDDSLPALAGYVKIDLRLGSLDVLVRMGVHGRAWVRMGVHHCAWACMGAHERMCALPV